ncbi:conserved hypothetical protein [Luminiphilus syltensis NOR5-1B]|uniref:Type 4 fimbrial biogenesis protein PilX N-terminal domain-containing protein n=1 Tax=Luminiphilus syltensis NOR5-1B TaxID=565045 RepID=B8KUV7_9GAMM|nr:PilX N-terminal domain-containing pilus assembly protein [Luminiphilus syltensis]EED36834.1 conserved hypothetical protein [Luminiphilus syltensis NOR5-1B]
MQAFRKQRGAALVVSLILLAVATLVIVYGMRGTNLQERMTANQNNKSISFVAAEAGGSEFLGWLVAEDDAGTVDWTDATWQESWKTAVGFTLPDSPVTTASIGTYGAYYISAIIWGTDDVVVNVTGNSLGGTDSVGQTTLQLTYQKPQLYIPPGPGPAFAKGLLTEGSITVNGTSSFTGSAHANEAFDGRGELVDLNDLDAEGELVPYPSDISASGTATFSGDVPDGSTIADRVTSDAEPFDVPSAADFVTDHGLNASPDADGFTAAIAACEIPDGDGLGRMYYCDGDVDLDRNASHQNVTILATGNITQNGSSDIGVNNALDVALVAGGEITLNGQTDTFGVFWAEGDVIHNGTSTLTGAVVSGGDFTKNGGLAFVQSKRFSGNLQLPDPDPIPVPPSILSWREIY